MFLDFAALPVACRVSCCGNRHYFPLPTYCAWQSSTWTHDRKILPAGRCTLEGNGRDVLQTCCCCMESTIACRGACMYPSTYIAFELVCQVLAKYSSNRRRRCCRMVNCGIRWWIRCCCGPASCSTLHSCTTTTLPKYGHSGPDGANWSAGFSRCGAWFFIRSHFRCFTCGCGPQFWCRNQVGCTHLQLKNATHIALVPGSIYTPHAGTT